MTHDTLPTFCGASHRTLQHAFRVILAFILAAAWHSASAVAADGASFVSETYTDGTSVTAGASFTKTWTIRNSGTTTWTTSWCLRYVSDTVSSGYLSTSQSNRCLSSSVAPGGSYTFSVGMTAPSSAGSYSEYWKLTNAAGTTVNVGGSSTVWATISVPSTDGATFVSETIADGTSKSAGSSFTKTWTIRNSGSSTWSTSWCLRYVSDTVPAGYLSTSRSNRCLSSSVAPGSSYTFSVAMTAPSTAGSYAEYWKLTNAAGATVNVGGSSTIWASITVPSTDGATSVSKTIADGTSKTAGSSFTQTWTIRNSGSSTWSTSWCLKYVSDTVTSGYLSTSQSNRCLSSSVAPGSSYSFSVAMAAPSTAGSYAEHWKLTNAAGTTVSVSGSSTVSASITVPSTSTSVSETIADVPYLSQHDLGSISGSACSSASTAMILAYHGLIDSSHASMVTAAEDAFDATATLALGLVGRGGLTDYLVDEWGFSSADFDASGWVDLYDLIRDEIDAGRPMILGSRSMSAGHYIVVVGYDGADYESADLIVHDPFGEWHSFDNWSTGASGEGLSYDFEAITSDSTDGVFVIVP